MRILLDSCVSGTARVALEQAGDSEDWCGMWSKDPGDDEILRRAIAEERVLVTLDKDFGDIAVLQGVSHKGIVRLVNLRVADQGPFAAAAVAKYGAELSEGAIVTVEPSRVRVRSRGV